MHEWPHPPHRGPRSEAMPDTKIKLAKLAKIKLEPGTYRLKQAVMNPSADRRRKNDWTSVGVWPEGMEVIITNDPVPLRDVGADLPQETIDRLEARLKMEPASNKLGRGYFYDHADEFQAIARRLEPCTESI